MATRPSTATRGALATDGATCTIEVYLGARIRTRRLARHETLRELAGQAAVTESFLSQVERGGASPSMAWVQRIARALDTSIAELFAADDSAGTVVRVGDRRKIVYQGLGAVDEFVYRRQEVPLH